MPKKKKKKNQHINLENKNNLQFIIIIIIILFYHYYCLLYSIKVITSYSDGLSLEVQNQPWFPSQNTWPSVAEVAACQNY